MEYIKLIFFLENKFYDKKRKFPDQILSHKKEVNSFLKISYILL